MTFFSFTYSGDVLESILSKDSCKVGLPTIEHLLMHPFWQDNVPKFYEQFVNTMDTTKQTIKLTTTAKDQITIAVQKTEQRLRDEQKSVGFSFIANFQANLLIFCCCFGNFLR